MTKTRQLFFPVLAGAIALSGCQRPAEEAIFKLTGKIFVFNYRTATANYLVTFSRQSELRGIVAANARFENPAGGEKLSVSMPVHPDQDRLVIESPALECVRKERPYKVTIAFTDSSGKSVETVEALVTSQLDASTLPLLPPVTGPGYDRNHEAYDDNGNLKMRSLDGCPA